MLGPRLGDMRRMVSFEHRQLFRGHYPLGGGDFTSDMGAQERTGGLRVAASGALWRTTGSGIVQSPAPDQHCA